jgi:hypothetical protein
MGNTSSNPLSGFSGYTPFERIVTIKSPIGVNNDNPNYSLTIDGDLKQDNLIIGRKLIINNNWEITDFGLANEINFVKVSNRGGVKISWNGNNLVLTPLDNSKYLALNNAETYLYQDKVEELQDNISATVLNYS